MITVPIRWASFPWPRHLYGEALKVLKEVGVAQTAMDIMFPNASPLQVPDDRYSQLLEKMERKNEIETEEIKQIIINNDQLFAEGVKSMGRVILSYNMSPEPAVHDVLEFQKTAVFKEPGSVLNPDPRRRWRKRTNEKYASLVDEKTSSISYPIPELMKTAHNFGFVNRDTDNRRRGPQGAPGAVLLMAGSISTWPS